MKLSSLFLFLTLLQISAGSYSQDAKISMDVRNFPLEKVFGEIEKQTNYRFLYRIENVVNEYADVKSDNMSLEMVLDMVLANRNIDYKILDNKLIVITPAESVQRKKISGTVTDALSAELLVGVNIVVEGTTIGAVTDINGRFSMEVPAQTIVLIFSYIGYNTERVTVSTQSEVDVKLVPDVKKLDEIVVVGYGTQKKATVTGAISSVGTKALLQSPQANISNALAGRVPGLIAIQRSGEPGNDQSTLRIRGVGTYATFEGAQDPLYLVDGIEATGNSFNSIDPNEIESISILKDASATAVYGIKGANGVVIVTTKKGSEGKPTINFTSNYAISSFTDIRNQVGSYEYSKSHNLAQYYDSYLAAQTIRFSDSDIEHYRTGDDPVFYPNNNWYDIMLKKSSTVQTNNLSISGGTKKVKYFVSAGYMTQGGLFKNTDLLSNRYDLQLNYKRYNFRSNLDFEVTKRLSVSVKLSNVIENVKGSQQSTKNMMNIISLGNPTDSPGIVDGKITGIYGKTASYGPIVNPIASLYGSGFQSVSNNTFNSIIRLNYNLDFILEGLTTHGTVSYNNYFNRKLKTSGGYPSYSVKKIDGKNVMIPNGNEVFQLSYAKTDDRNRKITSEFGLDYSKKIDRHTFTGMIVYNQSKYFSPGLYLGVPQGIQNLVGRATYDYKNRYMVDANLCYNGTENFAEGNRFGLFPSMSLGWNVTEEPFFPKNEFIGTIKFRGSYGIVGNDRSGTASQSRFLYQNSTYSALGSDYNYYYGSGGSEQTASPSGYMEGKIGNPIVTWEKAKKRDLGLDLVLYKDKIRINIDIWDEYRDHILSSRQQAPMYLGADLPNLNFGIVENKGYDGEIIFNDNIGDFNYRIGGNLSFARNKIIFNDESTNQYSYQNRTGQAVGQYFGYIATGIFNSWEEVNDANRPVYDLNKNKLQPGDIKYMDLNGDGKIDNYDTAPIGYSNTPEKTFGISAGGNYKGLDFSVMFQGATNVSVTSSPRSIQPFLENTGATDFVIEKSWTAERYAQGLEILYPHLSQGYTTNQNNYAASTFWYRDASYLRFKNIEIGYSFKEGIIKRIGMQSARIYINGTNLYTWDNLNPGEDPESPNAVANEEPYPVTRTINIGLSVKF